MNQFSEYDNIPRKTKIYFVTRLVVWFVENQAYWHSPGPMQFDYRFLLSPRLLYPFFTSLNSRIEFQVNKKKGV